MSTAKISPKSTQKKAAFVIKTENSDDGEEKIIYAVTPEIEQNKEIVKIDEKSIALMTNVDKDFLIIKLQIQIKALQKQKQNHQDKYDKFQQLLQLQKVKIK